MNKEAILNQLGYTPNEALVKQLENIENNTLGYEKIQKHILDLNDSLKINSSFVALSNSKDFFKIKIESKTEEVALDAHKKVQRFSDKFKIKIEKLENKETYYIIGFENQ